MKEAVLITEVSTKQGLTIEVWSTDFQHALDGHPEVTVERIKAALEAPFKVVQSKSNNRVCLFYNLELTNHPIFGTIYFCVVVSVQKLGKGKMETAYETTYVKTGRVLYQKDVK